MKASSPRHRRQPRSPDRHLGRSSWSDSRIADIDPTGTALGCRGGWSTSDRLRSQDLRIAASSLSRGGGGGVHSLLLLVT